MSEQRDERRRYPRRGVFVECRIEGTSARAILRITDLSVGGCYVDSRYPVAIGSRIIVRVFTDPELVLPGRVTTSQPGYGFGVEFGELSDRARRQILGLMTSASLQTAF